MLKPISFPIPLPDDPRKWDGWSRYNSPDPYERLCLDPRTNPSNELIEERFRELLLWWQKKLPLKNQPSNPLAQLLRSGLDESSRFLTEARVELLNPERRRQVDEELAAQAEVEAVAEFNKYVVFALNDKTLSPQEEETLLEFGRQHGLSDKRMLELIEAELRNCGGVRVTPPPPEESTAGEKTKAQLDPKEDFMRMLRLSGLDADDMTDDQRDAFVNMAENLGIEPGDAEDLVDLYLEEIQNQTAPAPSKPVIVMAPKAPVASPNGATAAHPVASKTPTPIDVAAERAKFPNFTSSIGIDLLLVPSGVFQMGSEAPDAAPNEAPITPVTLRCY